MESSALEHFSTPVPLGLAREGTNSEMDLSFSASPLLAGILEGTREQLQNRWGSHLREISSLSRETDPELFYEALFHLGQRLEREGHVEQAGLIYSTILSSPIPPSPDLLAQAQERLTVLQGGGPIGAQLEQIGRGFARTALDPGLLMGATSMGFLGKGVELLGMRGLSGANFFRRVYGVGRRALEFAPRATGFALEATAFPFAINGANAMLGREVSWARMGDRVLGSWFFLGGMRGGGFTARSLGVNPLVGSLGGVMLGHGAEVHYGLKEWHGFSNFTVEALGTWASLQVAGRFSEEVFGPSILSFQRVMNMQTRELARQNQLRHPRVGEWEWWNMGGPPMVAVAAGMAPELVPRRQRLFSPALMVKGRGESELAKKSTLFPSLLSRIGRLSDPLAVEESLGLLYIGTIGPLHSQIFEALVAVSEGRAPQPVLGALVQIPSLRETVFLSPELREKILQRIENLGKGSAPWNSPEYAPPKTGEDLPRPSLVPLTLSELHLSLIQPRYHELKRILKSEKPPISRNKLSQEIVQITDVYDDIVLKIIVEADRDPLTGFLNLRGLERITPNLESRLIAFRRHEQGPKLADYGLMIDIDFFKNVNDKHGHKIGDLVLRSVARRIEKTVRYRDFKVRKGGEEFYVYLAKSGHRGAEQAAEAIRQAVAQTATETPKGPISVTVSIGAAEMRALPSPEVEGEVIQEGALEDNIKRADEALYEAKRAGRNRVHFSSE